MHSVTSRYGCRCTRPRAARCARPPRDADGRRPAPLREPARAEPTPDPARRTPGDARCSIAAVAASSPTRQVAGCCGPRMSPWASCEPRRATCARSSAAVVNRCGSTTQCATTYQWLPEVLRALREREPGAEVRIEDSARRRDHLGAPRRTDRRRAHQQARPAGRSRAPATSLRRRAPCGRRQQPPVGRPGPCRRCRFRRCPPDAVRELRPEPRAARAAPHPDRRPAPAADHAAAQPGPADRDGRVRRRCRDDPSVVDRGAVPADPRPRQRASRRDTASAHLVLRDPPRSTAGEHRSLRLGTDRATRHAARRPESRSSVGRRRRPAVPVRFRRGTHRCHPPHRCTRGGHLRNRY